MSASARQARLNAAVLSRAVGFSESATFTRAGETTGLDVVAAITRRSDPVWAGGLTDVTEEHITGYLIALVLDFTPEIGDVLTSAAGVRYEIDQSPVFERGLWKLILRVRS